MSNHTKNITVGLHGHCYSNATAMNAPSLTYTSPHQFYAAPLSGATPLIPNFFQSSPLITLKVVGYARSLEWNDSGTLASTCAGGPDCVSRNVGVPQFLQKRCASHLSPMK